MTTPGALPRCITNIQCYSFIHRAITRWMIRDRWANRTSKNILIFIWQFWRRQASTDRQKSFDKIQILLAVMSNNTEHPDVSVTLVEGRTKQSAESTDTAVHAPPRSFIRRLLDNDVVKFGLPISFFLLLIYAGWALYSYLTGNRRSLCSPRSFCGW